MEEIVLTEIPLGSIELVLLTNYGSNGDIDMGSFEHPFMDFGSFTDPSSQILDLGSI